MRFAKGIYSVDIIYSPIGHKTKINYYLSGRLTYRRGAQQKVCDETHKFRHRHSLNLFQICLKRVKLCSELLGQLVTEFRVEFCDAVCLSTPERFVDIED